MAPHFSFRVGRFAPRARDERDGPAAACSSGVRFTASGELPRPLGRGLATRQGLVPGVQLIDHGGTNRSLLGPQPRENSFEFGFGHGFFNGISFSAQARSDRCSCQRVSRSQGCNL